MRLLLVFLAIVSSTAQACLDLYKSVDGSVEVWIYGQPPGGDRHVSFEVKSQSGQPACDTKQFTFRKQGGSFASLDPDCAMIMEEADADRLSFRVRNCQNTCIEDVSDKLQDLIKSHH